MHTDSTAAIGIVHRKGLGKTRHIEVQYLWVQDNVNRKMMKVMKIGTKENPADMPTKGFKRITIDEHIKFSGGQLVESRSKTALSIHAVNKVAKTMKVNLLQNGGDKQNLGNERLLGDDGRGFGLSHGMGHLFARARLPELLCVVDMSLGAENTARNQKRFPFRLLDMSIPRILALACDQNASDRQWELFFLELHASHRCAINTRPSRPGAPSHQAERGCSGLSPIR